MSGRAEGKKRGAPSSTDSKASKSSRSRRRGSTTPEELDVKPPPPTAGLKTTGLDDVDDEKVKALLTVEPEEDECKWDRSSFPTWAYSFLDARFSINVSSAKGGPQ